MCVCDVNVMYALISDIHEQSETMIAICGMRAGRRPQGMRGNAWPGIKVCSGQRYVGLCNDNALHCHLSQSCGQSGIYVAWQTCCISRTIRYRKGFDRRYAQCSLESANDGYRKQKLASPMGSQKCDLRHGPKFRRSR